MCTEKMGRKSVCALESACAGRFKNGGREEESRQLGRRWKKSKRGREMELANAGKAVICSTEGVRGAEWQQRGVESHLGLNTGKAERLCFEALGQQPGGEATGIGKTG